MEKFFPLNCFSLEVSFVYYVNKYVIFRVQNGKWGDQTLERWTCVQEGRDEIEFNMILNSLRILIRA